MPEPTGDRRALLVAGLVALALVQLGHSLDGLRTSPDADLPGLLADPLALTGIGGCVVAVALLLAGHRLGPRVAFAVAGAVALGFVAYHGAPADLGVNNPYWTSAEGSRADAIQWASVLVSVAVGIAVAVVAWPAATAGSSRRARSRA